MCTEEAFSVPPHDSAGYANTKNKRPNEVKMTKQIVS